MKSIGHPIELSAQPTGLSCGLPDSKEIIMTDYQFRIAQESDIPHLAKMYLSAYASRTEEQWTYEKVFALLTFLHKKQEELCLVAEVDQHIAGAVFGSVKPWWDGNHLIIEEIFVDPAMHGKGLGSSILKEICTQAAALHGATHVEAMTFRDTDHPRNWYFAHAFEEISEWMPLEGNMEKVLATL